MLPQKASGRASGIRSPCAIARCAISTRMENESVVVERISPMVAIADTVPKQASRFRFILDRRDVLGTMFAAPAILFVLLLVGVPFLMAVYYSVSAYTIYDPSWRFVGLANFEQIIE